MAAADISRETSRTSTLGTLASRVGRALSPGAHQDRPTGGRRASSSLGTAMTDIESQRGRQNIVSTGRGGAGNLIRSPSRGIDPETVPGGERGREVVRDQSIDRVVASGRGGAGNIRSPSRDPAARAQAEREAALQDKLVAESRGRQETAAFSTGRGGAGNISRSKSRQRDGSQPPTPARESSVAPEFRNTGRGGFGNIQEERNSLDAEKDEAARKYEQEVLAKHRADEAGKYHSSGKGGAGNMTNKTLTEQDFASLSLEEREAHERLHAESGRPEVVHGGRGGAGNYRAPKPEGEPERRGRDAHKGHGGVFENVMRSLSRAKNGERSKD